MSNFVDNTGLNEEAIARGLAVANSVTINFSTVSEDRATRIAIAHFELRWNEDKLGEAIFLADGPDGGVSIELRKNAEKLKNRLNDVLAVILAMIALVRSVFGGRWRWRTCAG
ncbi:MAG: hypothetical protein NTX73_08335 [Rhodobacterales bacterium]|nr:hypothetical protein [Rhodobacterales bacterium]